jgi:hypothetical protein
VRLLRGFGSRDAAGRDSDGTWSARTVSFDLDPPGIERALASDPNPR